MMVRTFFRWTAITGLVLLGGAATTLIALWTPDIDRETLEKFYANDSSAFVRTASGARIHYRDVGPRDADVLLLVHGTGASLHAWEPWTTLLSPDYRIVTLDLPGHGLTGATPERDYGRTGMIAAIDTVVAAAGLERLVIGGNSMGGEMALAYALAHPERIRGLVLVDSGGIGYLASGKGDDGDEQAERSVPLAFRLARLPVVNSIATRVTPRDLIEEGVRDVFADSRRVDDLMIDRYWHLLRLPGSRQAMLERFEASAREREPLAVERLAMPALVLWGKQDRLIPCYYGKALAERLPDARLVVYEDAGHIPMEEVPEPSAADVRRFLADLHDREVRTASSGR